MSYQTLSVDEDNTRHLSAGLMATCYPAADLERTISECGRASKRVRDLPAVVPGYELWKEASSKISRPQIGNEANASRRTEGFCAKATVLGILPAVMPPRSPQ